MSTEYLGNIIIKGYDLIASFGFKFIIALALLFFGSLLAKHLSRLVKKLLMKKNTEDTVSSFVSSVVYVLLWVFIIIAALSQIGIQTTSFIAVLGAAGLAIGLSLQGSLSNFAAGFLIILFKPFKVGDFIDSGGNMGVVSYINIFTTILKTTDNRKIIIPNSQITNSVITNITSEETRRIDYLFSVAYHSDIEQIKEIIHNVLNNQSLIFREPTPFVRMSNLSATSMDFTVRVWCKTSDYWTIYFDILEQVKNEFDKQNIGMPYIAYKEN